MTPAVPDAETPWAECNRAAPLLTVRDLTKTYQRRGWLMRVTAAVKAIDQVSLEVAAGELKAITGPSGAGKSTLARCIAGREPWDSGSIEWHVDPALPQSDRVQLVQQEPSESLNPSISIAETLREAGVPDDPELLAKIGLPKPWMRRKTSALSEGQRARVAILRSATRLARAGRGLLILDESLSGLDPATRHATLSYLRGLQSERRLSVLLITHDLSVTEQLGARALRLFAGRVAA